MTQADGWAMDGWDVQILEDGRLTNAKGRVVDFKNVMVVMTSNVGSAQIAGGCHPLGFQLGEDSADAVRAEQVKSLVTEELKRYFKPEFLNRVDETIVFQVWLISISVFHISNSLLLNPNPNPSPNPSPSSSPSPSPCCCERQE